MQYNSLVGDMGTSLSSGQKQRVLIARALYRRPRVLVMDEGTAHLDPARDQEIQAMLKEMTITRLVVAHSPAMAAVADRAFALRDGRLEELRRPAAVEAGAGQACPVDARGIDPQTS